MQKANLKLNNFQGVVIMHANETIKVIGKQNLKPIFRVYEFSML